MINQWKYKMSTKIRFNTFSLALALLMPILGMAESAEFPLVNGDQQAVLVFEDAAAKHAPDQPSHFLQRYLAQSTGREFKIVSETDYDAATMPHAVFVGNTRIARERFGEQLKTLGVDGYIVGVETNRVILVGGTAETTRWAQYDFLREYLGIDGYFPHPLGLVVPKHEKVLVPVGTRIEIPAFQNRALWGFNAPGARNGWSMGTIPWRTPLSQRGPIAEHTVQKYIPVKEFGDTHPEYFAMEAGRRVISDSGFGKAPCTSNPEVVKIVVDKIRADLDANPDKRFVPLGMTDGGYCECEVCKALDGPPIKIEGCNLGAPVVRRWYTFLNQVAAAVRESHPGTVVTTFAYSGCQLPPADLTLERNIMPFWCYTRSRWFDPEVKRIDLAITQAWLNRVDQIGIYEYYYGWNLTIPMLYTHDMADYLRTVVDHSKNPQALGMFTEMNASWGMDGPKGWILEKLMWNPHQDVDALTRRWCAALFDEAGPAMVKYFNELEALRVRNRDRLAGVTQYVPWKGKAAPLNLQGIFGFMQESSQMRLFPPEDVSRCQAMLAEAARQATSDVVRERVDYFAATFKLTEIASTHYHAYVRLNDLLWSGTDLTTLISEMIVGDATAPADDPFEYAKALRARDKTRFGSDTIFLDGVGLALRKIMDETSVRAVREALVSGERDLGKLRQRASEALMRVMPGQDVVASAHGQKRMAVLAAIADRVAVAKPVKAAPLIDGSPDEAAWGEWRDDSPWFNWQSVMADDKTRTQFAFAHDGKFLYVALKCPQADLASQPRCPDKYGAESYLYPSVELFLSTDQPGVSDQEVTYYQAVPAFGGGFSEHVGGKLKPARQDVQFKAVADYAITDNGVDEWRAEFKIDLGKLGFDVVKTPYLRMNLVRNITSGGQGSGRSWFPSPGVHRSESSRGWLVFEADSNLLKNTDFADWSEARGLPALWSSWSKPVGEVTRDEGMLRFTDAAQGLGVRQTVHVEGGKPYEVRCEKKVQMSAGFSFFQTAVQWRDKDGKGAGFSMELDAGFDDDVVTTSKIYEAPTNAVSADVIFSPYTVNRPHSVAKGNIWVGNVHFGPASTSSAAATDGKVAKPLSKAEIAEARDILGEKRHPEFESVAKRLDAPDADPEGLRTEVNLARIYPGDNRLFAVGAVDEGAKLYPQTRYSGSLEEPIRLALAGNEYGSFQLAVIPFWNELEDVAVTFSDLTGRDGAVVSASNFEWFRIGYVRPDPPKPWFHVEFPHDIEPDPLLPSEPFAVKRGELGPVWVDLRLPEGTKAGAYRGSVSVTANGQTVTRPIEIEAYGFDIPKTSSIANEFWLCPYNWRKFYGDNSYFTPELHARWAATLGRYRVSSFPVDWLTICPQVTIYAEPDGSFSFDWRVFDQYVHNALTNGTTAFWSALSCNSGWTVHLHNSKTKVVERATGKTVELGRYLPEGIENHWKLDALPYRENRVYRDFLVAYLKHLKDLGINEKSYYELFDEPGQEARFRAMMKHHQFLREVVPELQLMNFNVPNRLAQVTRAFDPAVPDDPRHRSAEGKLLTYEDDNHIIHQGLAGLYDLWAPDFNKLDDRAMLEAMHRRRAEHGEKVWAYTCIETRRDPLGGISFATRWTEDSYSPFINYRRPTISARIHAWMAWKYELDGFFVFSMNSMPKANLEKDISQRWPNSLWEVSDGGSGVLIYPGSDYQIVPGIRLASIRKGLEDYEYFVKLKALADTLDPTKDADLLARAKQALVMDEDIVASVYDWTKDRERLESKRRQLAGLIVDIQNRDELRIEKESTVRTLKLNPDWTLYKDAERPTSLSEIPRKLKTPGGEMVASQTVRAEDGFIDIAQEAELLYEKRRALLFNEFNAEEAGVVKAGATADWWMEIYLNGVQVYSTMDTGNAAPLSQITKHVFELPLKRGRNVLAAVVDSGSRGWMFGIGDPSAKPASPYHQGKAPDDSASFIPFDVKWPLDPKHPFDLRSLLDAPAGGRGWITVKDGHLAYPDGQRFRVFGVNLTNQGAVPEHDSAVRIAEKLSRSGVNCVRLGPAEALLTSDSDRRSLCPRAMEKFDFLVAELKKRGIYVYLRLDYGIRAFKPGDGVPDHSYTALYFNPRFQKAHRDYARQLLTHQNPYTGLCYVDDPAVLFVELTNEMSILEFWASGDVIQRQLNGDGTAGDAQPEAWDAKQGLMGLEYAREYLRRYNDWLPGNVSADELDNWRLEHGLGSNAPIPLLELRDHAQAPKARFQAEVGFAMSLERNFFLSTADYLRHEIGLRSLLIGNSNHRHAFSTLALVSGTSTLDVVDTHSYWQHPAWMVQDGAFDKFYGYHRRRHIDNTPIVDGETPPFGVISRSALQGKPLLVSEYNSPFPQEFSAEAIPLFAAYAAFQDWDGLILHTLCNRDIVAKSEQIGRPFDIAKDPQKMSQLAVGALLFLRQDVQPARETVFCSYSAERVKEAIRTPKWFPLDERLALLHGVRTTSLDGEDSPRQDVAVANPAISDTGELTFFSGSPRLGQKAMTGYFTIDTARTQTLGGFFNKYALQLANVSAETDCPFCVLTVSALDGKPIAESASLYVTANARVANSGMRWAADRNSTEVWGSAPVCLEPVTADLRLRGLRGARSASVIPLDSGGEPMPSTSMVSVEAGGCVLPLRSPTNAYLVDIRR